MFEDENMALLTHELISAAERVGIAQICQQAWGRILTTDGTDSADGKKVGTGQAQLGLHSGPFCESVVGRDVHSAPSPCLFPSERPAVDSGPYLGSGAPRTSTPYLYAGIDVGRHRDQTVITVLEKCGSTYIVRAILRLRELRLPDQQEQLARVLELPNFVHAKIDMTGIGLGLFEYTQQKFPTKISGVNFSSSAPLSSLAQFPTVHSFRNLQSEIRNQNVRVTELLATQLLQTFEDRAIQIPIDQELRDDLRKPERLTSPSGRVSIAATRDEAGHADHFWSLALALDAAKAEMIAPAPPTYIKVIQRFKRPHFNTRRNGLTF